VESEIISTVSETDSAHKQIQFKLSRQYLDEVNMEDDTSTNDESPKSDKKGTFEDKNNDRIGKYTLAERSHRIMKFKNKLQKRRQSHPISKKFSGRKNVALNKFRLNGKFAKASSILTA
jgi:hypothetical protein